MKRILLAATALFFAVAMKAQTKGPDDVIKVNVEKHDFGKILQGKPVDYSFEITNKANGAYRTGCHGQTKSTI